MARPLSKPKADRRARFAQEFAIDSNASQAARRSGYSARSAHVTASRLLKDAKVRAQIDEIRARAAAANQITVERTMREIARIAYGDVRKLYGSDGQLLPVGEMDDEAAAQLAGVETFEEYDGTGKDRVLIGYTRKVKRESKSRALDMCMSILGMHKTVAPGDGASSLNLTVRFSDGKRAR